MAISLKDVAKTAGVSPQTVSYVLNGRTSARIAHKTQLHVRAVARELGYQPNAIARSLVTGRSRTIGIIACELVSSIHMPNTSTLLGVAESAKQSGYRIQLEICELNRESVKVAVANLLGQRVDGIISVMPQAGEFPEIAEALASVEVPYASAYHGWGPIVGADQVTVDNVQGGYLAARHLIDLGARRLAFAGGPKSRAVTRDRLTGFWRAIEECGAIVHPDWITYGEFTVTAGKAIVAKFCQCGGPLPDAIVAACDEIAAGILHGCIAKGINVPSDLKVIGFDNKESLCDACYPTLSSVVLPTVSVGRLAAEYLVTRMEGDGELPPRSTALPCDLVLRESA